MLGETVLYSIVCDRLLESKASGTVPPSVLAGAARARCRPTSAVGIDGEVTDVSSKLGLGIPSGGDERSTPPVSGSGQS